MLICDRFGIDLGHHDVLDPPQQFHKTPDVRDASAGKGGLKLQESNSRG